MSKDSGININPKEPQKVSRAYLPVFIFRNMRAWVILILIYSAGPIIRGEARNAVVELGGFSFNLVSALLIGIAVIAIVIILFSILSYQKISWQITEEEVRIRKGIIRRIDKRIPISKIQSVDMTEKLIERLFNVSTVCFDTPGGNAEDGKIPCLDKEVGEYIKELVFAVKNNPSVAFDSFADTDSLESIKVNEQVFPEIEEPKQVIYKMPVKSLILTGMSNGKSLLFIFIIVSFITQIISTFFDDEIYEAIFNQAAKLALPILIGIILLFIIISWIFSVIRSAMTFFGFTVRNVASKIEIEQGLIDHKTISIEKHRIQEVCISQGLIRRIIGYAEISVKTATLEITSNKGGTGESGIMGTTVIHPFISIREIDYFLGMLLPEFNGASRAFEAFPKKAHARSIRRHVIWCIIMEVVLFASISLIVSDSAEESLLYFFNLYGTPVVIIAAVILLLCIITGHLSYKGRGACKNDLFFSIRKGAWGKTFSYIPRRKIQIAKVSENPFQRFSKLATIKGTTGAHGFPTLVDTSKTFAYDFLDWSVIKNQM